VWESVAGLWHGYGDLLGATAAVAASFMHANAPSRSRFSLLIAWSLIVVTLMIFASYLLIPDAPMAFTFQRAASTFAIYVAGLYASICDALRFGLAAYLTRKRGEKWVKELDYIYLGLGAAGVLGSVNRLNLGSDHYTRIDILGPIVVATALVVRLVKTRAEIGGWNKL
jgi:hypothetical protein